MRKPIKPAQVICNDHIRLVSSNDFVPAETMAKALRGRKVGGGWMARCPAHDDKKPSLSICEADRGKVLVRCHAGCEQSQVIEALRSRGLWTVDRVDGTNDLSGRGSKNAKDKKKLNGEIDNRQRSALAIWQSAEPALGSVVEKYLRSRRIHVPLPETIRCHGGLKHPSGTTWPAMVALVTHGVDDLQLAVHRTFLAKDGNGKAPVDPQKMMLGPCRGGAVRLAPAGDVLMIGEGIETSLAAMQATGYPAWAALSTSGLRASQPAGQRGRRHRAGRWR